MHLGDIGAGATLGRYELLLPIARGGMAMVWAARMRGVRSFQKIVAVKTLLPALSDDPEFEEMFLAEAELASQIRHPNVCEILDLGEQDGLLYIVMEWVDGEPLSLIHRTAYKKGGIPLPIATRIGFNTANGLHAAHELRRNGEVVGLVHRDVSPQNLLVTFNGVVKIVDFGVAKTAEGSRQAQTQVGQTKGKVPFMAPEQALGKKVDRRTDIFALGIVLFQMVTGKHPFRGDTEIETLQRILDPEPVRSPADMVENCPPALSAAIMRALEKRPERRFATMIEFAQALESTFSPSESVTEREVAAFMRHIFGDREEKRHAAITNAMRETEQRKSHPSAGVPGSPFAAAHGDEATSDVSHVSGGPGLKPARTSVGLMPPAAAPSALADVLAIHREGHPLSSGVRLRIVADILESLADEPAAPRNPQSRLRLDRVRVDGEGVGRLVGEGNASGAVELAWEILAMREAKPGALPPLGTVAADFAGSVDAALKAAIAGRASLTAGRLASDLQAASQGRIDSHAAVRSALSAWLGEAAHDKAVRPSGSGSGRVPRAPLPALGRAGGSANATPPSSLAARVAPGKRATGTTPGADAVDSGPTDPLSRLTLNDRLELGSVAMPEPSGDPLEQKAQPQPPRPPITASRRAFAPRLSNDAPGAPKREPPRVTPAAGSRPQAPLPAPEIAKPKDPGGDAAGAARSPLVSAIASAGVSPVPGPPTDAPPPSGRDGDDDVTLMAPRPAGAPTALRSIAGAMESPAAPSPGLAPATVVIAPQSAPRPSRRPAPAFTVESLAGDPDFELIRARRPVWLTVAAVGAIALVGIVIGLIAGHTEPPRPPLTEASKIVPSSSATAEEMTPPIASAAPSASSEAAPVDSQMPMPIATISADPPRAPLQGTARPGGNAPPRGKSFLPNEL